MLRKYGRFFNTHRVFRQYIWAWVLPTTLLWTIADFNHIDNVEQLWKVHSRRMQAQYSIIYSACIPTQLELNTLSTYSPKATSVFGTMSTQYPGTWKQSWPMKSLSPRPQNTRIPNSKQLISERQMSRMNNDKHK